MKALVSVTSSIVIICITLFGMEKVEGLKCYQCTYSATFSSDQKDCLQNPSAHLTDCNVQGTTHCRAYKVKSNNGDINFVQRQCVQPSTNLKTGCNNETSQYGYGLACYCASEACNSAEMPASKLPLAFLFLIVTFLLKMFF